ncbi:MAG: ester cyclase [Shinella sp.]|nr:ester cyclase [Shinella sp.]
MAEEQDLARDLVDALNARDFASLAADVDEDVAIGGIGEGSNNGREALRERLAHHFRIFDESYGDMLVMRDESGSNIAVRLTARGFYRENAAGLPPASGQSYSVEKLLLAELDGRRITRLSFFSDIADLVRQLSR